MKILRYRFPAFWILLLGANSLQAQGVDADILLNPGLVSARAMIRENQDTTIREELRLTDQEKVAFWPLYREYRADMLPIQDRYVALIAGYLQKYESGVLTEEYAEELLDNYFDIKTDLLRMRQSHIRNFQKILPMLKVARFYQLENKMIADVDAELALLVPLVESN